eukprot:SM000107S14083  [mRNA]  locus=s107:431471:433788:+ [translate_table: standard]
MAAVKSGAAPVGQGELSLVRSGGDGCSGDVDADLWPGAGGACCLDGVRGDDREEDDEQGIRLDDVEDEEAGNEDNDGCGTAPEDGELDEEEPRRAAVGWEEPMDVEAAPSAGAAGGEDPLAPQTAAQSTGSGGGGSVSAHRQLEAWLSAAEALLQLLLAGRTEAAVGSSMREDLQLLAEVGASGSPPSRGSAPGDGCRVVSCKAKKKPKPQRVDKARFVREACIALGEKKQHLVREAVKVLGVDAVAGFVREVNAVEACGGQLTADGRARRTPGGVLWNIVRSHVDAATYKRIMLADKLYQKELEKKRALKRARPMDVDSSGLGGGTTRRKAGATDDTATKPSAAASRSTPALGFDVVTGLTAGELELAKTQKGVPAPQHVKQWQNAWATGVRTTKAVWDKAAEGPLLQPEPPSHAAQELGATSLAVGRLVPSLTKEFDGPTIIARTSVKHRLRMPRRYDDALGLAEHST